jgi:transcription initiation factor IIE alpha subunit
MVSEQTVEQKISDLRHEFSKFKTQLGIKDEQVRMALEQLAESGKVVAERQVREAEDHENRLQVLQK